MGLFSTLTSSASNAEKTRTSTLDIPNVIQLYSSSPIIVEKNTKSRKFSVLSYQTVHVSSSAAYEGGALLSKQEQEATSLHPNLGVWNCRVAKSLSDSAGSDQKPLADEIFRSLPTSDSPPTICIAVDLSNLADVEPAISRMQNALVRYLIDRGQSSDKSDAPSESSTATTSLYDLRSSHFGLAVNDEKSAKNMSAAAPEEDDKKIRITLVISAMLPSRGPQEENAAAEPSTGGYKEKQAEALVLYHLRKYAASLNAVLCFVRKDKPSEEESKSIAALTLNQLSFVWHQLAKGEEGWKELDSAQEEEEQAVVSGIYGPGKHHEDLIESVLLRNAQFPGQWDAAKDSLWAALPQIQADEKKETSTSNAESGDEAWLSELRASVASEVKTPPPSASKGDAPDTSKTPNDAAVSSFFESLLKP